MSLPQITPRQRRFARLVPRVSARSCVSALTLYGFLLSHLALDLSGPVASTCVPTAPRSCCATNTPGDASSIGCCCCTREKVAAGNCCCRRKSGEPSEERDERPTARSCPCGEAPGHFWSPSSPPRMTARYFEFVGLETVSRLPVLAESVPSSESPEPMTPPPESLLLG